MKTLKYLLILVSISQIWSCTADTPATDSFADKLLGRWNIAAAEREGKPTESLANAFFEFLEGGKLTTNFNLEGVDQTVDYTLKEKTIETKGGDQTKYTIEKIENEQLVLTTELMSYSFKLMLEKQP